MKVLEGRNITKHFPGVVALDDVSISFDSGQIHCIIGENGAGKSTLIKCLTGVYQPEIGQININQENVATNKNLFDAVSYVPQEIDLFPHMSVSENLFLPYEKSGFKGLINYRQMEERAIELLAQFQIEVSPDQLVKDISVSNQQLLQVARATVQSDYKVLLLDEPTTSLTTKDTELLFEIIKKIKQQGKAVVFISHKLEEIFALGDVLTVFRNGRKVAFSEVSAIDIPWVIKQMTGKSIDQKQVYHSTKVQAEVVLEVKNLTGEKFEDISFELRKGEVLGFSGLVGAGRSELLQAIFGYRPIYQGQIRLDGKVWRQGDTHYAVKNGMTYLPEERKSQGIFPVLSVRENISLSALEKLGDKFGISLTKERQLGEKVVAEYDVKTPDLEREIKYLSGGNQQKVIIGRAMNCQPKVIIFDEPTKGIDVGTKSEIYKMIRLLAEEKGIGIILISSEMEEVIRCANRIITLYNGVKTGEFEVNSNKEQLISAIIGMS